MNRRRFLQRAGVLIGALLTGARGLFRGETLEMPVSLSNRSVFYPLWDNFGIKAEDVKARADRFDADETAAIIQKFSGSDCPTELHIVEQECIVGDAKIFFVNWSNDGPGDDDKSVTDRLDQFGQACAAQRAELSRESEHFFHYPIKDDMARILADNPEMTREDAFLQAVIERTESNL